MSIIILFFYTKGYFHFIISYTKAYYHFNISYANGYYHFIISCTNGIIILLPQIRRGLLSHLQSGFILVFGQIKLVHILCTIVNEH